MCRLQRVDMSETEAVDVMCTENKDAILVCNEILGYFPQVFPGCNGEEITTIKALDDIGVYGGDIASLYYDTYHGDTRRFLLALNAYCVGRIDKTEFLHPQKMKTTIH